jgi:hypothetical protein
MVDECFVEASHRVATGPTVRGTGVGHVLMRRPAHVRRGRSSNQDWRAVHLEGFIVSTVFKAVTSLPLKMASTTEMLRDFFNFL